VLVLVLDVVEVVAVFAQSRARSRSEW
jgi:hypothetical protein